jgi:hypothetical protein
VARFHIDSRVIPPCWEQHNGMVEALAALRDHERDCYAETAPPSAAVDWLRAFREIEARLIELASLTNWLFDLERGLGVHAAMGRGA